MARPMKDFSNDLYKAIDLLEDDKPERARALCKKILKKQPEFYGARHFAGVIALQQKIYEEAERHLVRALKLPEADGDCFNNYAIALRHRGKFAKALRAAEKAISLNSGKFEYYESAGIACEGLEEWERAIEYFEQSLLLNDKNSTLYINLSRAFAAIFELGKALQALDRAQALVPDSFGSIMEKIDILEKLGDISAVLVEFESALSTWPQDNRIRNSLARFYERIGEFGKARETARQVLDQEPDNLGAQIALLSLEEYATAEAIAALEKKMDPLKLDYGDRDGVFFNLSDAYEKVGDLQKSFDLLHQANAIHRRKYRYSIDEDRLVFDKLKQDYSPGRIKQAKNGYADETPIFILGMPRSGTTLTEQILSSHAQVYGAGELDYMKKSLFGGRQEVTQAIRDSSGLTDEDCHRVGADYVSALRQHSETARFITDKLPHNFLHIGAIRMALPNARIIHCNRNPIDTCLSIYRKNFAGAHKYAYQLDELADYYRLYLDLMSHWRSVASSDIFDIQYEEIVANPEETVRELLAFCDLEWDDNCLQFYNQRRVVNTASLQQVRKPIYKSSVEGWRKCEPYIQPLVDRLLPYCT